ncbi:hypothetical protein BDV34DRAFT_190851 [Aspergillus parasiticus]|uniref:Uncharacterized protein n=1 Tax=Aspergillus parasiticus TaxID=5067 RepID=A0A5N6DT05_ASPPA|nr:hypothetical protein BDV34DRAFT_190851 [Aspergillus parasiticus]
MMARWPSGLRRTTQVLKIKLELALEQLGCLRMMKIAWVRIPPLSVVFCLSQFLSVLFLPLSFLTDR